METPPNVIFIVLDTVRRDRVSAYGYDRETTPHFDSFVESATQFGDAVSQAAWSIPSHASLFTGAYPSEHGATTVSPVFRASPTLPELLSAAGYDTCAISPNEYIRPATGFGRGFDEFHIPSRATVPQPVVDVLAPTVNRITSTARVRRPIERLFNTIRQRRVQTSDTDSPITYGYADRIEQFLDRSDEPFFLFANLVDAHLPRSPDPAHVERFGDDELRDVDVVSTERAHTFSDEPMCERGMRAMSQLYDADLRTLDDRFGAVLTALDAAGINDSLVVVVSDHGEHLGEFNLIGHQHSVFDSVVSVPLAIQFPEGGPDRIDKQVETRRIFETILDETGVRSCPDRSLASGIGDDTARGEFLSPMLDLEQFLWDNAIAYDRDLLGETLSFARHDDSKRISFAGSEWLFSLPEHEHAAVSRSGADEQQAPPVGDTPQN